MSPLPFHPTHPPATEAGDHLRRLRRQAGLSQLDLALLAGLSQRHLSCVETGRAKASPATLHALLSALDVPLEQCNAVFLAAGYAPRYGAAAPDAPALQMVNDAVQHILQANNPAPAIVIASNWNITAANASAGLLFAMAGVAPGNETGLNLLDTLLRPGGLGITWSMPMRYAPSPGSGRRGKRWVTLNWPSACKVCQPRLHGRWRHHCRRWC